MSISGTQQTFSQRIGYGLKRTQQALRTHMDRELRDIGLTAPQYAVLSAIEIEPGISNAELARIAFVTAQSMQGIVANLERDGFIGRQKDPSHGRRLRAELTPKGREALDQAHTIAEAAEKRMLTGFDESEQEKLSALLARCEANLVTIA